MRYNKFYINIILVKKILVFLLLFFVSYSCNPISTKIKPSESIECPPVFFAAEDRNYFKSNNDQKILVENIAYKAEINNYAFAQPCFIRNNSYYFSLGVLLIVDPINIISPDISLPVYVALLDDSNHIIDMQYFSVDGLIEKTSDNEQYLQKEISKILNFNLPSSFIVNNIVIGFMLNKKQKEFLN